MEKKRSPRLVFYSHDTMGLGHIRRNLLLVDAVIKAMPDTQVLLINGVREAGRFFLPAGADVVTLPSYFKDAAGNYSPRSLGCDVKRLTALRSKVIYAALEAFEPDIFVIDNVPGGAQSELEPVLPMLAEKGVNVVLGLRDILDTPDTVKRQWRKLNNYANIRDYISAIWVYGDNKLYDLVDAYEFDQDIRQKLTFLGYLNAQLRTRKNLPPQAIVPDINRPYSLCVAGGGQDGFQLASAFASATFPSGTMGVLIAGSMMPQAEYDALALHARRRNDLALVRFVSEPLELLRQAQSVVAMGGYNTVTEILSFHKRALIVPRVTPRQEQWIRATQLAKYQLVTCIHPERFSVLRLNQWLSETLPPPDPFILLNFNGLGNFVKNIRRLLKQRALQLDLASKELI
ncbi:glycosyltransferase family protein [Mixta intestinalis]|uniref:Undecaprenyldiphospho-muramoylpentapeptide beta-N-acetylglucosaminyltransferase n=1 Tax=Mixta intestinalis TaxID=1615494 RepID=A0A6P1Q034_9GAMM|nr:glycosyl transferase family 28 [Mixta intestinalis]QHM71993.1 hypothetical protein C7M51_02292 [Mixta intestinalis]